MLMLVVVYLRALLNWSFFCLPMLMLVVVYLRALLNWSCLFTYVDVGCCVSQSSAELEVFVYLYLCWLLCISELC